MRNRRLIAAVAFLGAAQWLTVSASAGEYATKDEALALVKQAIARVADVGMDKAKPEFMDHGGKYIDRDLYLIVIDKDGMRVVHGQNPKLVGKQYFEAVDVNGKEYGKEVQQISAGPGKGWFSFAFKDPITGKVLPKENYVERAGDYTYLAGVIHSLITIRSFHDLPLWVKVLVAPAVCLGARCRDCRLHLAGRRPRPRAGWLKSPTARCPQPRRARGCSTTSTRSRRRRCARWSGSRPALPRRPSTRWSPTLAAG